VVVACIILLQLTTSVFDSFQILNDVNGNLDAKKACAGALKLHKKYLKKVIFSLSLATN
jgi:hypothetical protein